MIILLVTYRFLIFFTTLNNLETCFEIISDTKSYFNFADCFWLRFTGFCVNEINSTVA